MCVRRKSDIICLLYIYLFLLLDIYDIIFFEREREQKKESQSFYFSMAQTSVMEKYIVPGYGNVLQFVLHQSSCIMGNVYLS